MPDDTQPDAELQETLSALPRYAPASAAFTHRVLQDLGRRGLVRRSTVRVNLPWLAAAMLVFAAGIGVGTAIAGARSAPHGVPQPHSTNTAPSAAMNVNVPAVGKSEVWF